MPPEVLVEDIVRARGDGVELLKHLSHGAHEAECAERERHTEGDVRRTLTRGL